MIGVALSRREREILEIIHRLDGPSALEIQAAMSEPPTYSAVRATLRILEEKGHVRHVQLGKKYVYQASVPRQDAARSALNQVVATFFGGSLEGVVRTFLSDKEQISDAELDGLARLIEEARQNEGNLK
jgi:predicted transcriptional regulator